MKIFKKKAPVIWLGNGPLASKIVVLGRFGRNLEFGAIRICKYKDGGFHCYEEEITDELIGEPLVTILFADTEGIKKLADGLYKLCDEMEVD